MHPKDDEYTLECGCACKDWDIGVNYTTIISSCNIHAAEYREREARRLRQQALDNDREERLILQRKELGIKRKEHLAYIDTIQPINCIPIRVAIDTYKIRKDILHRYSRHLNVVKIKNKWTCSKEKLDALSVQLMTFDIKYKDITEKPATLH